MCLPTNLPTYPYTFPSISLSLVFLSPFPDFFFNFPVLMWCPVSPGFGDWNLMHFLPDALLCAQVPPGSEGPAHPRAALSTGNPREQQVSSPPLSFSPFRTASQPRRGNLEIATLLLGISDPRSTPKHKTQTFVNRTLKTSRRRWSTWVQGKAIMFDDCYEHEVLSSSYTAAEEPCCFLLFCSCHFRSRTRKR